MFSLSVLAYMLCLILNRNLCDWWSGWTSVKLPDCLSPPLFFKSFSLWCHPSLRLIVQHCDCGLAKWWGQQEFAIPQNVLEIVYGQTICWIGTFYSPILPAICTIKYFFIFYIKKVGFHFFFFIAHSVWNSLELVFDCFCVIRRFPW